jgi:dTDP-4-dehydrorhamnose 3,5-epimerase
MQMTISNCNIPEVKLISQFRHNDARGAFVKTFHDADFKNGGIDFTLQESFYSTSHKNVLRGMHYHEAPYDHAKIIFCTAGSILDVALDIRKESATYGKYVSTILSFDNNNALYIPKGFAHGFITLSEMATAFYLVDGLYTPTHDKGIKHDSFGFDWQCDTIITNERDKNFPTLNEL